MIDRRDLRVLPEGWYGFKIEKAEEVPTVYGPGVKISMCVRSGRCEGARIVLQTDRVATPGNKLGRLFSVIGFDPTIELPVSVGECAGREFGGRVLRYISSGRVKAKIVEFCLPEKVSEKIEGYELECRRAKEGGV